MKKSLSTLSVLWLATMLLAGCNCKETSNVAEGTNVLQPNQEVAMENQAINYWAMTDSVIKVEDIVLTDEWDKVFPQSDKVNHRKVTFVNHFGITLAADLYEPKEYEGKLPALAVAGPYSAVKEQVSGRYAQAMAERGFLAIAFDPSFYGESGWTPRYMNSPDINVEDFQAAVDFLSTLENVDANRIGIIGICGWWGYALQAAQLDTRIKATTTVTMYDMSRVMTYGYNDANDEDARYAFRETLSNLRTQDYKDGKYSLAWGWPKDYPEGAQQFEKDYIDFYAHRWYHPRSLGSNNQFTTTTLGSLVNMKMLEFTKEIRNPVLMVHGENAHSRYFSEDAYKNMIEWSNYADNKELYIVPGAVHTDLYDNEEYIPYEKIQNFFNENM